MRFNHYDAKAPAVIGNVLRLIRGYRGIFVIQWSCAHRAASTAGTIPSSMPIEGWTGFGSNFEPTIIFKLTPSHVEIGSDRRAITEVGNYARPNNIAVYSQYSSHQLLRSERVDRWHRRGGSLSGMAR